MQDPKISKAKDHTSSKDAHRKPYEPPTVTVIPLKIEERLLACSKDKSTGDPNCTTSNRTS